MFFFFSQKQLDLRLSLVGRWYDFVYVGSEVVPRLRGPYRELWCRLASGEVRQYTCCSPKPDSGCQWSDMVALGEGEMASVGERPQRERQAESE